MNKSHSPIEVVRSILSAESLEDLIRLHYPYLGVRKITLLSIGDNDNYLVESAKGKFVLRIYRYNKHWLPTQSHHLFEIDLLLFLKQNKISVSYPIEKEEGGYLDVLLCPEGPRYWGLFSYAPGQLMRFIPEACYRYGEAISNMHRSLNQFHSSQAYPKIDSEFLLHLSLSRIANCLGRQEKRVKLLQPLVEKLALAIERFDQAALKNEWGVIGGDFHGGNHFFDQDGNITLFDFDLCGYGWRTYDIAVFKWALFNICRRAPKVRNRACLWHAFLSGYQSNIPLFEEQLKMIPIFVQARQIWLMGSETTYPDKILDNIYWRKMFAGLKTASAEFYD